MRIWRVSNYADLSGEGGKRGAARWHSEGRRIVYLAEHPALALLENLVNLQLDPNDLPDTYQLLEVEAPDRVVQQALPVADLNAKNPAWRSNVSFTRSLGDAWLTAGETALCGVPSVILPKSTNVLLNPSHHDAPRVTIVEVTRPAYDPRLFRGAR